MISFYDLPAEIRNNVYFKALGKGLTYDLRNAFSAFEGTHNLLFASKQIYEEALPIYRAENKFIINTTPQTTTALHPLSLLRDRPLAGFKQINKLTLTFELERWSDYALGNQAVLWVGIVGSDCLMKVCEKRVRSRMDDSLPEEAIKTMQRNEAISEARYMAKELEKSLGRKLDVRVA